HELSRLDPANTESGRSFSAAGAGQASVGGDDGRPGSQPAVMAPPPEAPRPEPVAASDSPPDMGADEDDADAEDSVRAPARHMRRTDDPMEQEPEENDRSEEEERNAPPALTGKLASIMKLVKAGKTDDALLEALAWHKAEPGDVLALVGLGEALEGA